MDVGASTIAGGDGTTEDVVCADHEPDGYMRQDKKGWGGGGGVTQWYKSNQKLVIGSKIHHHKASGAESTAWRCFAKMGYVEHYTCTCTDRENT